MHRILKSTKYFKNNLSVHFKTGALSKGQTTTVVLRECYGVAYRRAGYGSRETERVKQAYSETTHSLPDLESNILCGDR